MSGWEWSNRAARLPADRPHLRHEALARGGYRCTRIRSDDTRCQHRQPMWTTSNPATITNSTTLRACAAGTTNADRRPKADAPRGSTGHRGIAHPNHTPETSHDHYTSHHDRSHRRTAPRPDHHHRQRICRVTDSRRLRRTSRHRYSEASRPTTKDHQRPPVTQSNQRWG